MTTPAQNPCTSHNSVTFAPATIQQSECKHVYPTLFFSSQVEHYKNDFRDTVSNFTSPTKHSFSFLDTCIKKQQNMEH